jgi:cell division protein FtsB
MEIRHNTSEIESLVNRATGQDGSPAAPQRETRIYNSVLPELEKTYSVPNQAVQAPPKNRKAVKRKVSPFNIVLVLLSVAVVSVFYISNILTVGRLLTNINKLQNKHRQVLNEQELLKAEIDKLSGLERVQPLARERVGLINPKQAPVWIQIDPRRVEQVEKVTRGNGESMQGR